MTDDDRVVLLSVAVPRAPGVRLGVLRVWPVDPRADLGPLLYTSLTDDEIVAVLRRLARGEEPGVDLEAHRLDEAEWRRRREARGRALPPLGGGDDTVQSSLTLSSSLVLQCGIVLLCRSIEC